jgi:uncharacterized protein (DUF2147 family)
MKTSCNFITLATTLLLLSGCDEAVTEYESSVPTIQLMSPMDITPYSATLAARVTSTNLKRDTRGNSAYISICDSTQKVELYRADCEYDHVEFIGTRYDWYCNLSEMGITLTPGTTYSYKMVISDGISEVSSAFDQFTTVSIVSLDSVLLKQWGSENTEPLSYDVDLGISVVHPTIETYGWYDKTAQAWMLSKSIAPTDIWYDYVCAYAPYAKTGAHYKYKVPVSLWESNVDYLYGHSTNPVSETSAKVTLVMNHALARVQIKLSTDDDAVYGISGTALREINSQTPCLYTEGEMDVFTGEITNNRCIEDYHRSINDTISKTQSQSVEMYVIPTSFDENMVYLDLYGSRSWYVSFPASKWEAGKTYSYSITIKDSNLSVSDVNVQPWESSGRESEIDIYDYK